MPIPLSSVSLIQGSAPPCPFFARVLVCGPGGAWYFMENDRSNQCALITRAHSPCILSIAGLAPDWDRCPRNPQPPEEPEDAEEARRASAAQRRPAA